MAADFDSFERAYRLRSSADEDLLRQVFGEEDLAELSKSRPALLETARVYFPHLTSCTYERLAREPETLKLDKDRCEHEMEQLAVQNYGAFIGSAKVTQAVKKELEDIRRQLDEMGDRFAPLQDIVEEFKAASANLGRRRASLRNVLQQHSGLLELLELPQVLDACIRSQMYDESLELFAYCGTLLQSHEVRGDKIPVLERLAEQVAVQRLNLHSSLVAQLKTDIHLPACVRVMGFLRRIKKHSESELRCLFIEHRGSFLQGHKQHVELLRNTRGSVVTALRNAADLLRTHVYDIGTQYKALFPQDDGPLHVWLNEQIQWLAGLLQCHILPRSSHDRGQGQKMVLPGLGAARSNPSGTRIDAAGLTMVLRQCFIASSTLKRLGGQFFPSVAHIFEARMEQHICEMLDIAILTFRAELGRYDWVPSTALASNATPLADTGGGGAGPSWLHPQALELTRHRPLAVLTNDLIQVFNELRQCTLQGLRAVVMSHCTDCFTKAISLLKTVKSSHTVVAGSVKAKELERLCLHLAHILMPLISAHLETIFGSVARLDIGALVSSMVPDLLPQAEAEYSMGGNVVLDESLTAGPAVPPEVSEVKEALAHVENPVQVESAPKVLPPTLVTSALAVDALPPSAQDSETKDGCENGQRPTSPIGSPDEVSVQSVVEKESDSCLPPPPAHGDVDLAIPPASE